LLLLAVCAVSFAQLVALAASERTAERTRRTAVDQLQNVMEYLAVTEPEKIISGDFDKTPFDSLIERSLPDGKIVFETKTIGNNNINNNNIENNVMWTITVSWSDGEKRPRKKVSMFRLYNVKKLPPQES
jgi:hypothetical protein